MGQRRPGNGAGEANWTTDWWQIQRPRLPHPLQAAAGEPLAAALALVCQQREPSRPRQATPEDSPRETERRDSEALPTD